VYKLILDSDGVPFLFSPIFCRMPVSRYVDCYSLAKISETLAGQRQYLTYSEGESPPIKAGQPEATPHLATACEGCRATARTTTGSWW
jgi:hypothetical protein